MYLTVRGIDDSGALRRNRRVYDMADLREGTFPRVVEKLDAPTVDKRPVDWTAFYEFEESVSE